MPYRRADGPPSRTAVRRRRDGGWQPPVVDRVSLSPRVDLHPLQHAAFRYMPCYLKGDFARNVPPFGRSPELDRIGLRLRLRLVVPKDILLRLRRAGSRPEIALSII